MKKMVLLIAFCLLTLVSCASYSSCSKSYQKLDGILVDININSIDPIIDSLDELFLSAMRSTSKHFSKWEE